MKKTLRVLGISGSPREGGNTDILLGEALAGAEDLDAETELIAIRNMKISPCDGCESCRVSGRCHIDDDMQKTYGILSAAEGIIFATPVYMWSMTGQLKIFMERLIVPLNNKVGGVITVASRTAALNTAGQFYLIFSSKHMLAADWVIGYAARKGAIRKDRHAMKAAWHLGKQVVLLARKNFEFPAEYASPIYRHVVQEDGISLCPTDSDEISG